MDSAVLHLDSYTGPNWMTTPFKEMEDGSLQGRAIITSTGIFSYLKKDGTIFRELRLPEEVFSATFLNSVKGIPITLDHNPAVVTPENAAQFSVGRVGDDPSDPADGTSDNYHLSVSLKLDKKEGVNAVKKGKKRLSVGYKCDVDPTPGVWCGQHYDGIQRNLVANHLSLVTRGRQGDAAQIRMDAMDDDVRIMTLDSLSLDEDNTTVEVDNMADDTLKSVKLDGVDYKAEAKVLEALHAANTRVDGLGAELADQKVKLDAAVAESTKLSAERDAAKERADKAELELAELKKNSISRDQALEMARARLDMEAVAVQVGVKLDKQDDITLMKEILAKKEVKLDGKDDLYVRVRYDILRESIKTDAADDAAARLGAGEQRNDSAVNTRAERLAKLGSLYKNEGGK